MKSKSIIINELLSDGFSVIENYYNSNFCKKAIEDINRLIKKNGSKLYSVSEEGTSGDQRLFKIENQCQKAKFFKEDKFIKSILNKVSKRRVYSCFTLGGKLKHDSKIIKNSGGGWHRDGDKNQYKAIIYLNDVDKTCGPFTFIRNSKCFDIKRRKTEGTPYDLNKQSILEKMLSLIGKGQDVAPRYSDDDVNDFIKKKNIKPIELTGKQGTLILVNVSYIHRGKNIEKGVRYTFTNYFFESNILSKFSRNRQFGKLFMEKLK